MNILYICHRIPYPPNKGDKIRSFNEIKFLSEKHRIFLACLIDNKDDIQYVSKLKRYCDSVDFDVINPRLQKARALPSLFHRKPMSVPYFYSRKLQNAVNRILSRNNIDIVFVFSSPMAQYMLNRKDGSGQKSKLIMDFVDVDSDKWRMYAEHSSPSYAFVYRKEWKSLMRYEKEVGEQFDLSLFVSENEVALYNSFAPDVDAIAIPNGVDFEYFSSVKPTTGDKMEKNVILFTGAMDYFPNEDAVLYFSHSIWPEIKKRIADAVFYVVGSNPSKRVQALSESGAGIVVTGYVPDIREYFKKASVFVAPLRIARGIQNKVLDAMAAGVPVVARPEAVQGLSVQNGCVGIADNENAFADSVIEIMNDPAKRGNMIESATAYIHEYHNWQKNLDSLEAVI